MKYLTGIFLVLSFSTFAQAASLVVDQDDAFANLAFENAQGICAENLISNFVNSADGKYVVSIVSKVFPNGLKSISFKFESKTKVLSVVKSFSDSSTQIISPICNLATKGLGDIN